MSVSGIINTHFIVAYMLKQHGTQEQKDTFLPRMALGEVRGAFSMSEPALGSDVSAISSKGVKDGEEYVLNGQKMWLTNGGTSTLVAVLARSDEGHPEGTAPHKSMTTFLVEKEPGFGEVRPGLTSRGRSTRWATRASIRPSSSWTTCAFRPIVSSGARRAAGFTK